MENTIFQNLWLLSLTGALLIGAYGLLLLAPKKKKKKNIKIDYDILNRPFNKNWANDLYAMSFKSPLASFIPEEDTDPKAVALNKSIAQAGYSMEMDYRVLNTLQILLFMAAVVLTGVIGFILANSLNLWCALFNLKTEDVSPMTIFLIVGSVLLLTALLPKLYIKSKANRASSEFIKNLPVIQIFLVSMMKSKRPIDEVLYTFGQAETVYKSIFANAYRIYSRDRNAAFEFLHNAFNGTGWDSTITTLETLSSYDTSETVKILSNQIRDLEEEVNDSKLGKRNIRGLISEGSVGMPFLAFMLLVIAPLAVWALDMVSKASSMA